MDEHDYLLDFCVCDHGSPFGIVAAGSARVGSFFNL
jgi:hypothetical protein